VECFQCGASNPEEHKYCGSCGTPLDPDLGRVHTYLGQNLAGKVREILREELKDRDVAATEITEAVTTKLVDWAKLLAFAIGIPLFLVTLALAALGISTYKDFKTNVEGLKDEVTQDLETTWEGVQKLRARLNENRAFIAEVEALRSRVRAIENKFGVTPSPDLSPELKRDIEDSFKEFISYLESLGYQHKGGEVEVVVNKEITSDNAFYEEDANRIVIAPAFARDSQVVFHTYTIFALQSLLDTRSPLKQSGEVNSITSGLADYFTCSFSGQPLVGEIAIREMRKLVPSYSSQPYLRNLANDRSFAKVKDEGPDAWETWGGLFWELRYLLRPAVADQVLYSSWTELVRTNTPGNPRKTFAHILLENCRRQVPEGQMEAVRSAFQRRGLEAEASVGN